MRYAILLVPLLALFALACNGGWEAQPTATAEPEATATARALYTNPTFKVELQYPASWVPDPDYSTYASEVPEAFSDPSGRENGFFHVNALHTEGMSLEQVAASEVSHRLKPYGDSPQIVPTTVAGREGRLILPDTVRPSSELFVAELLVAYSSPVNIGAGGPYQFLVMYGHRDFIESIAETIRMLD